MHFHPFDNTFAWTIDTATMFGPVEISNDLKSQWFGFVLTLERTDRRKRIIKPETRLVHWLDKRHGLTEPGNRTVEAKSVHPLMPPARNAQ